MFWAAVAAGLAVSIPPGPLGALCVIRTVRGGLAAGLMVGVAVACVDGFVFGTIATFGASLAADLAPWVRRCAAGLVAIALFVLGLKTMRGAGKKTAPESGDAPRFGAAWGALLLALGTPGTLPALIALFSTLEIDNTGMGLSSVAALGVFAGGLAWWTTLCLIAHFLRERAQRAMRVLDYTCGALLWLGAGGAAYFAIFAGG